MLKMTKEQKALFDDLTTLQQEIALNSISGMNDIDSYKNSRGEAKTVTAMESGANQILRKREVSLFVDSMKVPVINDAIMSRERMMELQTIIADITSNDLSVITLDKLTELKDGFNVKLKAMKQLADLGGYNSANKIDLSSTDGTMTPKNFNDFYGDNE